MRNQTKIDVSLGFKDTERAQVATLFWNAFSGKLGPLLGPDDTALAFIAPALDPAFALAARDTDDTLLGIAGFHTTDGQLMGGSFADLRASYGLLSSLWRAPLLALLERDMTAGVLLMDGILVAPEARGRGVGTALLNVIKDTARDQNCHAVQLDVIDTNPRARALYERQGFVATTTMDLGPLRHIFRFSASTTMVCDLTS